MLTLVLCAWLVAFAGATPSSTRTCPEASAAGGGRPCVPKCCPLGQSISEEDHKCRPTDLTFRPHFDTSESFDYDQEGDAVDSRLLQPVLDHNNSDIIVGDPCEFGKYRLAPFDDASDDFYLYANGTLWLPAKSPSVRLGPAEFCVDTVYIYIDDIQSWDEEELPFLCFDGPPADVFTARFVLYSVGLLFSVLFLVATVLVYCLLPELRNLHGKTLVCYLMCVAVAHVFLAAVQLGSTTFTEQSCSFLAFVVQFAFQASFFWFQVLCFDTWWVVRSSYLTKRFLVDQADEENATRANGVVNQAMDFVDATRPAKTVCCFPALVGGRVPLNTTEKIVFLCYSLYAWIFPAVYVVAIAAAADRTPTIPSSYVRPDDDLNRCWFNSQEAEFHYFYGTVAFVVATTLVMFVHIIYMIWHINTWNHPGKNEKRCFVLCLSLFFVLCINWFLEAVSWAANRPSYLWHVTDFFNALHGIILFCIFVLQPYVRSLVRRRLWPRVSKVLFCKCSDGSDTAQAQPPAHARPGIVYSSVATSLQPKVDI